MSNWDSSLPTAEQEGQVRTLYPPGLKLPMAAPNDLGHIAAQLLAEPVEGTGVYYVEGPERYSSADVAKAFGAALGKPVEAVETPREQWVPALTAMGFSAPGAESMAAMAAITLAKEYDLPNTPHRGPTSLDSYVKELVAANQGR